MAEASNGQKYAVLIGINYYGTSHKLNGCINDVNNVKQLLLTDLAVPRENIVVLTDEESTQSDLQPTAENIRRHLKEIVAKVGRGDTLFVHYSGHGSYTWDDVHRADETDGQDEVICPVDGGLIADDELNQLLVLGMPDGSKLFAIFDCCHSGSILDMPHRYRHRHTVHSENKTLFDHKHADCLMISGCRDDQTSADAWMEGAYTGALTWAFLKVVKSIVKYGGSDKLSEWTWQELLLLIRYKLRKKTYEQIPQLSATKRDLIHHSVKI